MLPKIWIVFPTNMILTNYVVLSVPSNFTENKMHTC